tara:strand:+ start:4019 stop:4450 length:432 start_codon:yes stop_codon:yes gene_type:complete
MSKTSRANRKSARQSASADRKSTRRLAKAQRKQDKFDFKLQKNIQNNGRKTMNATTRGTTRQTAYNNGIDPNAWIADTVDSVGDTVVGVVQAQNPFQGLSGGTSTSTITTPDGEYSLESERQGSSNMTLILLALGGFLLFKKK